MAPGATGKSFWALEAAMSVACAATVESRAAGGDLVGLAPAKAGRVVYYAGEDPEPALIGRIHSVGKHLGQEAREAIIENLMVMPIMGKLMDVTKKSKRAQIIEQCEGARLIVLDTLSRIHTLDENSNGDVNEFGAGFFGDWFGDFDGLDIYAILAACPCTEFATSGARHFAAKDADGRTVAAVQLVHQTLRTIEYFRPAVWAIENPVGRIEKLGGLPPWRLAFDPHHLGDPYTKKTLLWGRFNANLPIAPVEASDGSKMHRKFGGNRLATKNARSATPEGFSYGFFMANNAQDNPALAIAYKYDRLDAGLLRAALDANVSAREIDELVADAYYMDMDDSAAESALRQAISTQNPPT